MAAGDILKEGGLEVETYTIGSGTDLVKGKIYYNSGSGMVIATTGVKGPYFMATESRVYATDTTTGGQAALHQSEFVKKGYVECVAAIAGAAAAGQYAEISGTAGEVTLSDVTNQSDVVGIFEEAAATTDTTAKILLGAMP